MADERNCFGDREGPTRTPASSEPKLYQGLGGVTPRLSTTRRRAARLRRGNLVQRPSRLRAAPALARSLRRRATAMPLGVAALLFAMQAQAVTPGAPQNSTVSPSTIWTDVADGSDAGASSANETGGTAAGPVAATPASPSCPAPTFGTRRNIWTATVTVAASRFDAHYGFYDLLTGALSDKTFAIGSNNYEIKFLMVEQLTGDLQFGLESSGPTTDLYSAGLTSAERTALRLHVCDTAYDFNTAILNPFWPHYTWNEDLDWSSVSSRTVHLSLPAVEPDDEATSSSISLTAQPPRVSESDGATDIAVTATLDAGARTEETTVSVSVSGSGNADAVDFADVADFTITIAGGDTSGAGTFTLTPIDDEVDESDETLSVTGSSVLTVNGTEVELADDDATSSSIALTAEPPRVSEGDGATPVRVTATLDAGTRTEATTVTVTVSGSGNAGAVDFADVRDFTIMIAAGDTSGSGTFTLTPEDDNVDESDETLTVNGSSVLPVTADTVALADNDQSSAAILLSASPGRIAEDGGASPVQVTATLDASARTVATTVSVSVSGSGRPDAVDYAASATAFDITIAAGATAGTGTFTVTPEDDEVDERDEVLDVAGASDLPVTPASVTLADDEQTSTEIVLSAVPSTVSEGAGATPVEVTATLDAGARTVPTTVTVGVTGSGDPDAVDFASVRDLKIMIAAGATSGRWTFTLTPEDDDVAESSETLTVDGSSDLPVTKTSVTLTDDDVASSGIVLSASPSLVSEDGGAVPVKVTASLNGAVRQAATTVTVSVSGSGNSRAVDFQAVADFEIKIAANAANGEGTFTLTPVDDGAVEADETLTLSGASDLPVTPTTVTLADDDDASTRILLSAVPGRISEGDGPTPVTVTATLDRSSRQQATSVTVSVSGSGDAGASDFAAVADFEITIPADAGNGTGTFTLTPEDDETVESDERLTVSGISDLPVTPAAVTLADDDEVSTRILLFLTVDPVRASEGDGEVRVTVTAAVDRGARPDETRIAVSVAGSGDPDAVDFAPIPDFEIVIPANAPNGTATFAVVPEDDLIVEADETLTVSGVSDLPVTPATMELLDDDEASMRILLSADPARVSEGDGPVAVTVTASLDRGLRQEATTVTVSVSGGGDPDAVDFAAVADFAITIEANAPSGTGTFTLTPEDDAVDEADETLALTGESDLPVTPATGGTGGRRRDASAACCLSADPAPRRPRARARWRFDGDASGRPGLRPK